MNKAEIIRLNRAIMRDRKGSSRPGVAFNKKLWAQIETDAQTRISTGERVADIAESLAETLRASGQLICQVMPPLILASL